MSYIPVNSKIPPQVGEYAYFDSRINNQNKLSIEDKKIYLINTEAKSNLGCYYSLDYEIKNQPFITCHGKIIEVVMKT